MKIDKKLRYTSGVYKITNTINNKCYIGSSVNLYNRGCSYKHLIKRNKLHNKHLQSSVNKYGYEAFVFDVLERCNKNTSIDELHELEQFYINKIQPEYNKRYTVDTNHLLEHSKETKSKISKSLKKAFKNGSKVINRVQEHNVKVTLFDLDGNLVKNFEGLSQCAEFLGITYQSVGSAIVSKTRRTKQYIVLKTEEANTISNFVGMIKTGNYNKSVTVLDVLTNKTKKFDTVKSCCEFIKCKQETLKKYYKTGNLWKKRYKILEYE